MTFKRIISFIFGMFLVSFAYNLFLVPNEIVTGGASGLAVILKNYIDPSISLFIFNGLLIVLGIIFLGLKKSLEFLFGSLLFPVIVAITLPLTKYIDISSTELILQIIFSAVISGLGVGFVLKAGFSTGGTEVSATIISKYERISIGHALLICDGLIILLGFISFGLVNTIYSLIFIFICTRLIDNVVLGISNSKSFFIKTKKVIEISTSIQNDFGYATSIIDSEEDEKIIFCNIKADDYFRMRRLIKNKDDLARYFIVDGYETANTFKRDGF